MVSDDAGIARPAFSFFWGWYEIPTDASTRPDQETYNWYPTSVTMTPVSKPWLDAIESAAEKAEDAEKAAAADKAAAE